MRQRGIERMQPELLLRVALYKLINQREKHLDTENCVQIRISRKSTEYQNFSSCNLFVISN